MKFKTEASVLSRLKGWRELFGAPFATGRANPDNDIWYLLLDAEECIEGLQRYARSLEKSCAALAAKPETRTPPLHYGFAHDPADQSRDEAKRETGGEISDIADRVLEAHIANLKMEEPQS